MLAGEPEHKCMPRLPRTPQRNAAAAAAAAATPPPTLPPPPPPPPEDAAAKHEWAKRAARRLRGSTHVLMVEDFEAGKQAAPHPLCTAARLRRSGLRAYSSSTCPRSTPPSHCIVVHGRKAPRSE